MICESTTAINKIKHSMGIPEDTPYIEAHSDLSDPFFSRPILFQVTTKDIKEAKRRDHYNCAIACAVRNTYNAIAACINSRMVYIARRYPENGPTSFLRGKYVLSRHQLSADSMKMVRNFDKNPNRCPRGNIAINPIAPSHTREARRLTVGTGEPHKNPRPGKDRRKKRPTYLRTRIAPAVSAAP